MKANLKQFGKSDEAVSPVIGVILMVAITVVLAAVVFVLANSLTDTSDQAPRVQFGQDESGDLVKVITVDDRFEWGDLVVRATGFPAGGDIYYDLAANGVVAVPDEGTSCRAIGNPVVARGDMGVGSGSADDTDCATKQTDVFGDVVGAGTYATPSDATVRPADQLVFCHGDAAQSEVEDVTLAISHEETNTVVGEFTFASIDQCANAA